MEKLFKNNNYNSKIMGWYALENVGEAVEETRDFLIPFDLKQLTKLAIIVFLTGSGFNIPSGFGDAGGTTSITGGFADSGFSTQSSVASGMPEIGSALATESGANMAVAGLIIGIMIIVGLPLMLISSVFEFIFYRSLIDKEVKIVESFKDNFGRGLRYFGFRIIYSLFALLVIGGVVLVLIEDTTLFWAVLLPFIPVLIVMSLFAALTKHFILLRMMEEEQGLIEAWRSFWPELTSQWKQVLVFLFAHFGLSVMVGAATGMAILVFTIMAAIPVIIVAALLSLIAEVLFVIPVVVGVLIWIIALLYIAVPFRVYMRYFVILVYHDLTS